MWVNRPNLHPMVATAIRSFADKGLTLLPEHILWLQDAAQRIKKVSQHRIAEMVDWPVECGGVLFYRLSILATEWIANLPSDLQESVLVQAWASAHSHDQDALNRVCTPLKVRIHVWAWSHTLKASKSAIGAALASLDDDSDMVEIEDVVPKKKDALDRVDDPVSFGPFVLALCRKYTQAWSTPEYWSCKVSLDFALDALRDSDEQKVKGAEVTAHAAWLSVLRAIEKELTNG